jgi:hypothetical protein
MGRERLHAGGDERPYTDARNRHVTGVLEGGLEDPSGESLAEGNEASGADRLALAVVGSFVTSREPASSIRRSMAATVSTISLR